MHIQKFSDCDDGESFVDLHDEKRIISITGQINEAICSMTCATLQAFASSNEPVYLYINSDGGYMREGYAIVDQMLLSPFPVHTIVRGHAASMAAIIAAYGAPGCRFITPRSGMMIHSLQVGNSDMEPIEKMVAQLSHISSEFDRNIADMSKRMKVNKKQLLTLMKETEWLSPSQSIKIGLVDGFWTKKMEKQAVKGNDAKKKSND